eukprot:scaffold648034_cov45-Prasinocladus_malaysianus.AAC.1
MDSVNSDLLQHLSRASSLSADVVLAEALALWAADRGISLTVVGNSSRTASMDNTRQSSPPNQDRQAEVSSDKARYRHLSCKADSNTGTRPVSRGGPGDGWRRHLLSQWAARQAPGRFDEQSGRVRDGKPAELLA